MIYLLYTIHIVIGLFLIAIVLLQQGKGADLSVFGGGATQTAFGARGATTLLHKLTVGAFVGFIVTTLLIGIVQARGSVVTAIDALPAAAPALPSEDSSAPGPNEGARRGQPGDCEFLPPRRRRPGGLRRPSAPARGPDPATCQAGSSGDLAAEAQQPADELGDLRRRAANPPTSDRLQWERDRTRISLPARGQQLFQPLATEMQKWRNW